MSIFEIIISPFIFIIKQVFLLSFRLTNDYGVSIILLSFAISLLLLPIFILIEKAKKKDDTVKGKMKPLVDEIKRCYKGQERYYYLKTLNRQFTYSPLRALIPVLSLLLQIPFFIAAYQFLEGFQPLQGVSFLFINDLSQPDALFGAVNILPIAMTLVNLLTAYFYTRNGDASERKQMLVVAGIFLILLFKLPSGLVLYWTMNNVFSFFRLFVTNPEVFKKKEAHENLKHHFVKNYIIRLRAVKPMWKGTLLFLTVVSILLQLNWVFQNDFGDIWQRLLFAILGSSGVTVFLAAFASLYKVEWSGKFKGFKELFLQLWPSFKTSFYILVSLAILSQINWAMQFDFNDIIPRVILAILGSAVFTIIIVCLVLFFQGYITLRSKVIKLRISDLSIGYKILFWVLLMSSAYSQIIWAMQFYFDDIIYRLTLAFVGSWLLTLLVANFVNILKSDSELSVKTIINRIKLMGTGIPFFSLFFLAVYFYMASMFYYSGINADFGLIALYLILVVQIIGFFSFIQNRNNLNSGLFYLTLFVLVALVVLQGYSLLILDEPIEFLNAYLSWLINNNVVQSATRLGFIFAILTAPFCLMARKTRGAFVFKPHWFLYFLAVFYLAGFIFLWNPLTIYSSYPDIFDFPAIEILKQNFGRFAISLIILMTVYLLLPKKLKQFWFVFVLSVVLVSFVHNTIVPINLGSLQENKFLNEYKLAQPLFHYILEGFLFLFVIFGVNYLLRKKRLKALTYLFVLINMVLISQGLFESSKTGSFWLKPKLHNDSSNSISFSKEKENVVFVIVDMFHGWYMNKILEENPEVKDVFSGFKWYPNTLSISFITSSSIAPILGGFDYSIDKLNRDKTHTMESKITDVTEAFLHKIKSKGYNFTGNKFIYSKIDKNKFDTFLPEWHDDWNQWNSDLDIGVPRELGYTLLWENATFYSAPLFLKPLVYNNGRWMHKTIEPNENTTQSKHYNFLRLLPFISNAKSDEPNFIYLHSMASHHPWDIVDDKGKMHFDVSPYENNEWVIKTLGHWIEWMKANDVYDNTKIVLLSDHGPHWDHYKGEVDMDIPLSESLSDGITTRSIMGLFPLLMVKDFGRKPALELDWRFMSNADATSIAFDENDPTKIEPPLSRTLPATTVYWTRKIWLNTQVEVAHEFRVKDNVFELKNWEKIK